MESSKLVSNALSKSLPPPHSCQILPFAGQNDITQQQNKGLWRPNTLPPTSLSALLHLASRTSADCTGRSLPPRCSVSKFCNERFLSPTLRYLSQLRVYFRKNDSASCRTNFGTWRWTLGLEVNLELIVRHLLFGYVSADVLSPPPLLVINVFFFCIFLSYSLWSQSSLVT